MGQLYHGSSQKGITRLELHKSTHGNFVYATPYKELAIIFSGRCGDDMTYSLYRNGEMEPWKIVERIPKAFETMYNNSSSLYTLDDATFKDIHTGFAEVVSESGVNINTEEYIDNVYDAIKTLESLGKVQLYEYPNKPKDIPWDDSDLITKEINQAKRTKRPITKQTFTRLLYLHPNLIDQVNKTLIDLDGNFELFEKEDLITIFEKFVLMQLVKPDSEQYLSSAVLSISQMFPELMPQIQEKLSIMNQQKEVQIDFLINNLAKQLLEIPQDLIEQAKSYYKNDERSFSQIGLEILH